MTMAYEKVAMGNTEYLSLAAKHQEQLEIHDFYSIDTQIEQVANSSVFLISFCWAEY